MGYYNDIMDNVHNPDLPSTPPYSYPNRPSGLPWEGYYYSAYGIAVKHGYVGTEEEWLASLKGERGFYTELRYNAETNYLQQKHEGETEWTNLMSLTELQTELEAATIDEVEDARDAAQGYAESSGVSADAAAASADAAELSADNAATYASTAETYATRAANYKDEAGTSAETADQYARDSNASAISAENSATDASGYATAAAGSATDAEAAVTAAENAQTAAENAQTSAENAAQNASTYAGQAQSHASNAASSATAAGTSASQAASSASTAGDYEHLASLHEASAENFAAAAEAAQTAAETAKTAAEAAQTAAESARDATISALGNYRTAADQDTIDATKADKTALAYTDKRLKYLYELTQGQAWDTDEDSTEAYSKAVPAGAKAVTPQMLGGKSVVWNQLSKNEGLATDGQTTNTFADGVYTCVFNQATGTAYRIGGKGLPNAAIQFISGHKYYRTFEIKANNSNFDIYGIRIAESSGDFSPFTFEVTTSWQKYRGIATATKDVTKNSNSFQFRNAVVGESFDFRIGCIVDLTQMFGAGNEPTATTDERILAIEAYLAAHPEYNPGEIVSAKVTEIISAPATIDYSKIAEVVRNGEAEDYFSVGDQIVVPWIDKATGVTYQVPLDVVAFGTADTATETGRPAMFLQWHYCTPFGVQFDAREAMYAVPADGLAIGTYHFNVPAAWSKILVGDYQFTTTQSHTEGQQFVLRSAYDTVEGGLTNAYIDVYANGQSTEVIASYQITNGNAGTDLGAFTAEGGNNLWSMRCANYGYNRWAKSGIRQWLNSSAGIGAWWTQQSAYDRAPDELRTKHGFMSGFEDDFLEILQPIKISTALNTVTDVGIEEDNLEDTFDTFFLPALTNENINPQLAGEGDIFDYWKKASQSSTPLAQSGTYPQMRTYGIDNINTPQGVRLRSALRQNAYYVWLVGSTGYVGSSYGATASRRCAPVCAVC